MGNLAANELAVIAGIGFLWLLPVLIILFSSRTSGKEKLAWVLGVLFISWFAWIFYFLLAPIKKNQEWQSAR